MRFLPLTYTLCVVLACGSAPESEPEPDDQARQQFTASSLGVYPIAYLSEPLRLTADGEKYIADVQTLNATSYRYAVVMTEWRKNSQLAAMVLNEPKFVDKLMKSAGDTLMERIVDDPATMDRVKRFALQVYSDPQVSKAVMGKLQDEEVQALLKLASGGSSQRELLDIMKKLSKNTAFMTALLSTLAMKGDFLAQALSVGKENSLLAEILDQEFINELIASGSEANFLSRIVKLDVAVEQLEASMQRLLNDEETLRELLLPSSFEATQELMRAMLGVIRQLDGATRTEDVNYLKEQIDELITPMTEQKQLIAIIFSEILFEAAFIAYHPDFCEEDSDDWETVTDLDGELLVDNLGSEGLALLCLIAVDDNGNQQPEPTVEPVEPPTPTVEPVEPVEPPAPTVEPSATRPVPILKLGGNLPEPGSSSALRRLNVQVLTTRGTVAGYRWLLLRHGGNCPINPAAYSEQVRTLSQPIITEVQLAGPKTLCAFGVDEDGVLITPIASHRWELHVVPSAARLEIGGATRNLYFGDHQDIVLRNIGDVGMFWHISAPDDIDWLEIRKELGEWVSLRRASASTRLLHGAIRPQNIAKLQLRVVGLADEMQEAVLHVKHHDSAATFPIKLKLHSGKPRLTAQNIALSRTRGSDWIGIINTNGEGTLRWKVRHAFPTYRAGIGITTTSEDRIDKDGWYVGAGSVKVEMLIRPYPTTPKVQVLIFEFRGGKRIPVGVTYAPSG